MGSSRRASTHHSLTEPSVFLQHRAQLIERRLTGLPTKEVLKGSTGKGELVTYLPLFHAYEDPHPAHSDPRASIQSAFDLGNGKVRRRKSVYKNTSVEIDVCCGQAVLESNYLRATLLGGVWP